MEKLEGKADTELNIWKLVLGPQKPERMDGRLTSSWEGIRVSAVHRLAPQSPGASPRPCRNLPLKSVLRHFLQCGMQKLTHPSIQSLNIFFFLRIQSLPDTVLCWVCSREQGEMSGPLQGHWHLAVLVIAMEHAESYPRSTENGGSLE